MLTSSLAVAMALTGCGSDGNGGTSSVTPGTTGSPSPTPSPTATPTPTPSPTPTPTATSGPLAAIASNFDPKPLIVPGYDHGIPGNIPPSMAPDVVGAFRFICTAGQLNYDDPIVYPGVAGGSAHLHQYFGNSGTNYQSTYATLRTTGDSTCSNALNRSAYWAPALMNEAGQVIRPDYLSVYYKRIPAGDPMCQKTAADGCFDLPTGLRIVTGYDMTRMSEAQPENIVFSHACVASPTPRATLAEAVADCGGAGQITTSVFFPNCWDGRIDSANHRAHLVAPAYVGQSYPQCPADHPKLIPELFLGFYYTIAKSDGAIYFSSDRMNGMTKVGGTTFHTDYMEGWDPAVAATWHANCINKLLNCSDGELGDGTMLKRGALTLLASPRTVGAPTR